MPPCLPILEAIREYVRSFPNSEWIRVLVDLPEVSALIPEIAAEKSKVPASGSVTPETARLRLFDGIADFLNGVSQSAGGSGLVLCLDDLHWADQTTLLLVLHLARKAQAARILVAGSYRIEDSEQSGLADLLASSARERLGERITLNAFSLPETREFIAQMIHGVPDPAAVETLHSHTNGNPFFIEETVWQLRSDGRDLTDSELALRTWNAPESIRAVITQRYSRLSDDTKRILQVGSVIGNGFSVRLAQSITDLTDEAAIAAFEEAGASAILREDGETYVFRHPIIQRVLYEGLSLARRQRLHARVAEASESAVSSNAERAWAAIGHHWRLGGRPERAIEFYLRAGDAALLMTAWAEAASFWEKAESCMAETGQPAARRARLLEGAGDLYFLSSFGVWQCMERYEKAADLYKAAGDLVGAARAQSRAGRSLAYPTSGFDYPAAVEHLRTAEKALRAQPPSVELGEIYAALAHAESHALRSRPDQMLTDMARLQTIAEALDNDFLRVGAYSLEGHYLGLQGRLAEGLALEALACEKARTLSDSSVNDWPDRWRDFLLAYSSEEPPPRPSDAGSYVLSRWYGRLLMTRWTAACCGLQSMELNDPLAARDNLDTIRDPQGRLLNPFLLFDAFLSGDVATLRRLVEDAPRQLSPANDVIRYGPTMLAWCEGRWSEVESHLSEFAARMKANGSNSLLSFAYRWLIRIYRSIDDTAKAQAVLDEWLNISVESGAVKFEFPSRVELALLLTEGGQPTEAESHLIRVREILVQGEDWRGLSGRAAIAEAAVAAAQGSLEVANHHFEQALPNLRQYCLPWDEAEAYEIWARSCCGFFRGQNRRTFIAEKINAAVAVYERIGAGEPWIDRLRALERRLAGSTTTRPEYPNALTEREVEVLKLLARGASNREIADNLVISMRTVERHITHIYGKIGARGKADATAFALKHSIA